jgi:hypothetical protein
MNAPNTTSTTPPLLRGHHFQTSGTAVYMVSPESPCGHAAACPYIRIYTLATRNSLLSTRYSPLATRYS